ncbi:response regulator transcription factor [Streptomyces sp. WAC06614]|uniref:response regulator n=1 Tax=Streptomyces sp. WAC06614 TaxID=2487416 RepID=UPI000F77E8B5|nr:response regulator transcription factor [Streptomyces sp. WAC06614]RSS83607.1 DNA-binding response regulator [Streptomyces sp. WAC06614]
MDETSGRVRVLVVDDHPVYRDGIVRALTVSGRAEVVAEAENGVEALEMIRTHAPDVTVIDYYLGTGLDGIGVVHAAVRDHLPTRLLMLSANTDSSVVFKAVEEGAAGYLPKDANRSEIVDAVIAVARGRTVIPPELAGDLAGEIRLRADHDAPVLSERERQVLQAFARGLSIPQTAGELFIGASTVKTHTQRLYEKLGVSDRAAAVAEAMRRGLLE